MKEVVIVGLGALGSHVVQFARNWKVTMSVVDFDKIESKNTQSQFHMAGVTGLYKTSAIQRIMKMAWHRNMGARPVKLVPNNAAELLTSAQLIIDCTDNIKARNLISETARFEVLHGCMSNDGLIAQALWGEHFEPDEEDEGVATCEDGENLPLHAMYGGMIAWVAQQYLSKGIKQSYSMTPTSLIRVA